MKRFFAALIIAVFVPACALAQIRMDVLNEGDHQRVVFDAQADMPEAAGKATAPDPVLTAINMQIEARFEQEKAKLASRRAGAWVVQDGGVYQNGKIASMWRTWQGEQPNGMDGSSAAALTVSLETGMEIYLDELFDDPQEAIAAMEAIISEDVLDGMSDYMEYSDLLPMPVDCYAIDERGLTVFWTEDRYRYFDGTSGSVTFLWHEIADYIGENSPIYEISRPQAVDVSHLRSALALGRFDGVLDISIRDKLGEATEAYLMGDPDYTTDALVFPLERMRGFAVEIPKYAETQEEDTPVSAIRAGCISYGGLMTGKTKMEELYAIFGKPVCTIVYDEDAAMDVMLEPGESLFFEELGGVLQAHFDENGVLSCLILRTQMPQ